MKPEDPLPAVVTLWAADETKYSLVYALSQEAQKSGFRTWECLPKSLYPMISSVSSPGRSGVSAVSNELHEVLRTLPIRLRADGQGNIDRVTLGEDELQDFKALRFELSMIQDDPDTSFDRALLKIDSQLTFSELVRVIALLKRYRIRAITFVEMGPGDGC